MSWLAPRPPIQVAAALAVCVLAAAPLAAQGTGTIRGRVTDIGTQPISDVQIAVTGTRLGAITGVNGTYTIANVPAGLQQIVARRMGYARGVQTITVTTGGDARVDFSLMPTASQLEAVVVTGTAGAVERRTVGNSITQLDVADLTNKSSVMSVTEVLQAKTPGITISPGSGTLGTASDIALRGDSSFTANRPVVYIDGVRMHTDSMFNFTPSGSGASPFTGQRTSALDLVNPEDIESIEVIKGPAAATLYGADAAAGVIQIITKKGQRGQQRNRWGARAEYGRNQWGVADLVNYTTCTTAYKAAKDGAGNPVWPGCQALADNEIITDNPFKRDPFGLRDGAVHKLSASLRGGGDRYSYYVSGENNQLEGIQFNSFDSQRALRSNFAFSPAEVTDVSVNLGYIRDDLQLPLGDEAANGLLLSAARAQPGRAAGGCTGFTGVGLLNCSTNPAYGWATSYPAQANRYNNRTWTDRFTVGTTINYSPFAWLRNRATLGMDLTTAQAQVLSLPGDIDVPLGFIAQRVPRVFNYTIDYSGSADRQITKGLLSTTSIGAQVTANRTQVLEASGTQLPAGGITTIGSAITISGTNRFSEFNSVGEYLQEQVAWNNRLYVTGALRGDAHSSFGENAQYITYPKASFSYVLSEEPRLQNFLARMRLSSFRLRGAWGRAGRAPQPYFANPTYTSGRVAVGTAIQGALRTGSFGNPNLKPESGTELEGGFDADFLNQRLGLEFTYYDKVMHDLLVNQGIPPSLGFSGSQLINIGKTRNHGSELAVRATPIDNKIVSWDVNLGASWNRNKLVTLDSRTTDQALSGLSYTPGMQHNRVGYPLGAFFVQLPVKDASGGYLFTNSARTNLVLQNDTINGKAVPHLTYIGTPTPKSQYSLSSTVTLYRNWRVYALFDHQGQFYQMNYKEYNRCLNSRLNCAFENDPGADTTLKRVYAATNSQVLYLERGDFTKLRDLSVTYTLPPSLGRYIRAGAASVTVAGHNLQLWSDYSGLDPEVNEYANATNRGNSQFGRADAYSMPMTRRYSIMLNLTY